ncbi:hypothetical protein GOBAR_AA14714 [Gossypium barbadense]|uniref:Uncharacterized protein n=1 Tax=Gossypium barbadense TaxID=3634 RepID=A0A2P5XRI4_GOSBA|nr:hypothetical protein GOBAR_AA14714 [Gossypium barbadense]
MANYLNFDIYDLELTHIHRNSDLRRVLIATGNRSILVVEDINCGLELHDRQTEPQLGVAIKPNRTSQSSNVRSEKRSFVLSFHKKHKEKVLDPYLPFVLKESKHLMEEKKTLKLHTLGNDHMRRYVGGAETWQPIKLDHPANFGILVMNTELKATIMEDLERFVKRKDYYRRVGKAWKRVTLSALLNFIDGLWSSCGEERIIVFTTNHKDRLDPALLRPRRMDVHIHMSYCSPSGFDTLAVNYLGVNDHHPLMSITKELLAKTSVTPAEIGEQLLMNEDPEAALKGLIDFLQQKVKKKLKFESVINRK